MESVEDAVEHYWDLKQKGEMDIGEIRQELMENPTYTKDEVTIICRHISHLDIEATQDNRHAKPFLDHILLNYFFFFFWILVIVILTTMRTNTLSNMGEIPFYILIGGAGVLIVKNLVTIVRRHMGRRDDDLIM